VNYIAAHPNEVLNGLAVTTWLSHERKLSPAAYKKEMSKQPSGLNPSTWGGALEKGSCVKCMYAGYSRWEQVHEGYELISEALPEDAQASVDAGGVGFQGSTITITWTGIHYNLTSIAPE